jgi:hypothetical protein
VEAALDIVPEAEVEVENEEEPMKKMKTPAKTFMMGKVIKRSPSGKGIRNYSPILSKKKSK